MAKKVTLSKRDKEKVKRVLLARKAEILNDLVGTESEIDQLQDPKADDLDRAVEAGAMELLVALEKLENGTYGICEACLDEPLNLCPTCPTIPRARLEALPTARLCVATQEAEEKHQIPQYTRLRPRRKIFGEDAEEFTHPLMDKNDDD
jgi:DnaK suppressor protein